jgi:sugar phosphate isomerase/epimerase
MEVALSTSWNASRQTDARRLIEEIAALGFSEIELSFNLNEAVVEAISGLVRENAIKVVSLHNFCPAPRTATGTLGLPDHWPVSSQDESQRQLAVAYTKMTIDNAVALDARAVVLHAGRVEVEDYTRRLITLFEQGEQNAPVYADLFARAVREREAAAGKYLSATVRSLEEIVSYAQDRNILLGLENRFYYREIPALHEIGPILNHFKGSCLHYWHDVGHARVMEVLGFASQREMLAAYAPSLAGCHLHNSVGCRDHLPPHQGEMDLSVFVPYLRHARIKVIEAHPPAGAADIQRSGEYVRSLFREYPA